MLIRVVAALFCLAATASAQSHIVGYGGALSRYQADRQDFSTFRSGPVSTVTATVGAGGGTSIWKVRVDGTLLFSRTGLSEAFIAPFGSLERSASGRALLLDAGGGWPLFSFKGFQTTARAGYGAARVRVPTEIAIEADQRFWTYGLVAVRDVGSRYVLRIDVRGVQFKRNEIPETLGFVNIVMLGGFGFRF